MNPVFVAVKTYVAGPASANSQGLTSKPVREELAVIFACTGPVGTRLGAVYVECGGQTWPKKMLAHTTIHTNTRTQRKVLQGTLPSYAIRYEKAFSLGNPKKKGSALRASRASL